MGIEARYRLLLEEIAACCRACGRSSDEVSLIAVSKTVGEVQVMEAFEAGARDFGENRPDQIAFKQPLLPEARWHFIGNVQSRRIPDIVAHADLIHSVFQERHLTKIDDAARALGKTQRILVEVNVSGEETKSGLAPAAVASFMEQAAALASVRVCGLMTMAPRGDGSAADACFSGLAFLRDELRNLSCVQSGAVSLDELSMGMSEDWRSAIPHGATMVRIGRAVFSDDFAVR